MLSTSLRRSPLPAHAHPGLCFNGTAKTGSYLMLWQCQLQPEETIRPDFRLIQVSEFHFAVPGVNHVTASPARAKV